MRLIRVLRLSSSKLIFSIIIKEGELLFTTYYLHAPLSVYMHVARLALGVWSRLLTLRLVNPNDFARIYLFSKALHPVLASSTLT